MTHVTIVYIMDDTVRYEVDLDDQALAELIQEADRLKEESEDRA